MPVRLFAERADSLEGDIRDGAYFTSVAEVEDVVNQVLLKRPFRVAVLLDSSLPARNAILKPYGHLQAHANMARMQAEISRIADPVLMQIWFGWKNAGTPYPSELVEPHNFESETRLFQVGDVQLTAAPIFPQTINGALFWTIIFHNPTGRIFFTHI